jgi:hypothetical protein
MSTPPRINLDKLLARIVLDINLLHWFATTGGRRGAVLSAIALARRRGEQPVLDFLERHITGGRANG